MPANDDVLRCYLEELSYLRRMGERFAHEHPKIARRLELQSDECPDPHVERLIESFAFLTARIQSNLEHDFPEVASELLNVLYPHYLNPIPSMTIVRFDLDPDAKLTEPQLVPRQTQLFTHTAEGAVVRFRTAYPVTLWPIEVVDATFGAATELELPARRARPASVLRLRLRSRGEPFERMGVDRLRFYLHGDMVVNRLYPMLLAPTATNDRKRVAVVAPGARDVPDLPYLAVEQVGFADDEDVIHYPRQSHPAYRLLQEYFAFEEKFHFIDVTGLRGRAVGQEIDLLFLLDGDPRHRLLVSAEGFELGCTPAVNLFEMRSEPIRVDQRRTDYKLTADYRRERAIEIHSIRSVSGSSDVNEASREYAPFYSYTHAMARRDQSAFWHARRVPSLRDDAFGSDIYLSFHDSDFDPSKPADEVVFAHLLCTNGRLAAELPAGCLLQTDDSLPLRAIVNLRKPTRPFAPQHRGEALWRLVSHLSLNYLTLEGEGAVKALREILFLYALPDSRAQRQRIDGIKSLAAASAVRRMPGGAWNGFVRGTKISLTFDDSLYAGHAAFLFGSVLSQFLGLHASINSFTQLSVLREGDEHREKGLQWPAMAGGRAVL
jgi:type VI secretion system protein ImpG